ncbi:MAG: restriction endonuclease, SacI family [Deltaproteobacteria bacterium]|nr:restriction endonuclease, SacI family [Deltaproteobacteria bacterium]
MSAIDYHLARELLEKSILAAEKAVLQGAALPVRDDIQTALQTLFRSKTQAYREVLLGCTLARILDKSINIRQPYTDLGPNAFSGRSLDEKVINPFLHEKRIPSTHGLYLSVFRRSVRFDLTTRDGLRDKKGYDAFLSLLNYLESTSVDAELGNFLQYLLYKFVKLRESAAIPLFRPQRLSLDQYDTLISGLLNTPSGGRFPLILVVATFFTIKHLFGLQNWTINSQDINVADVASGAGGDITITSQGQTLMAVEVTERPVDRSRVVATFNTKIAPAGIEDYLFCLKTSPPSSETMEQARQYFAQGHEVNFVEIKNWILMLLATIGKAGRALFNKEMMRLLEEPHVPKLIKIAWNEQLNKIFAI